MKILRRLFGERQETDAVSNLDPFEAAQHGKTDFIEKILKDGFDALSESKNGGTLLHYAAQNLHYSTSRLLIEQGLDPQLRDKNGHTPADWASMANEIRMGAPSEAARAYINWLEEQKRNND